MPSGDRQESEVLDRKGYAWEEESARQLGNVRDEAVNGTEEGKDILCLTIEWVGRNKTSSRSCGSSPMYVNQRHIFDIS